MNYTYEYPRPSVTTDIVIFSIREDKLHVLLIQRDEEPFEGSWAIPGGFVLMNESLLEGATRELKEETGLCGIKLEELGSFSAPDRDPRGRVITVAFVALVPSDSLVLRPDTDARDAKWFALDALPELAFDHPEIMAAARQRLVAHVTSDVSVSARSAFEFLPEKFTLAQAQTVFEVLRGSDLDKRNFRKWIMANWELTDLNEKTFGGRHRPAALYSLD